LEWVTAAEGEKGSEQWECVACAKTFKSEAAWDSHERSRKHAKQVESLKREMQDDEEEFTPATTTEEQDQQRGEPVVEPPSFHSMEEHSRGVDVKIDPGTTTSGEILPVESPANTGGEPDDEPQEQKILREQPEINLDKNSLDQSNGGDDDAQTGTSKREKRQARQAKKAFDGQTNLQVSSFFFFIVCGFKLSRKAM
jgi:DnaJ homolog subfamily A member 5